MLLPVALAAVESTEDKRLATPLLLGIAYAASIGGIGTPIGTPPNMVVMGVYNEISDTAISFGQWMLWALPVVLVLLPIAGFWITRNLSASGAIALPKIGAWRTSERRVLIVFSLTALLWVTRTGPFGGWSSYCNYLIRTMPWWHFCSYRVIHHSNGERNSDTGESSRLLWQTAGTVGYAAAIPGGHYHRHRIYHPGLSSVIGTGRSLCRHYRY